MKPRLLPRIHQRGAATLVMVLGLFMVMALAAAYASRGLVFEQRISSNNLRATQAFEAAEAGLEWAIGMLGQGTVDGSCRPTGAVGFTPFRDRYLSLDGAGMFSASAAQAAARPTCSLENGNLSCSCPDPGNDPVLAANPQAPVFQVRFIVDPALARPGMVRVESRGCSSLGEQCYAAAGQRADAEATVSALVALSSALAQPPLAAMTVRGNLDLGGGAVSVANGQTDESGGIALAVGGTISNDGAAVISGAPGTPAESARQSGDAGMAALTRERLFISVFGTDPASYKHQPALLRPDCSSACAAALSSMISTQPGRPLWIEGDMDLTGDVSLGTDTQPVVLVVDGDVRIAGDFRLKGLLYLRGTLWDVTAGTARVQGAVVAEDALTIAGAPSVVRQDALLDRLRRLHGSLVRVPGSWRDFAAR